MAMAVTCATFLHASASPGFSSAKLSSLSSSSSIVSSIPAQSRLAKLRPPSTFGLVIISARARDDEPTIEDFQSVLVKRNKLQGELAQNRKKIEGLRTVIELACTELSTVLDSLEQIEQELSAEPETENHTVSGEPPAKRPRPTRSGFLIF